MNQMLKWFEKTFGYCRKRLTELGSEGPFPPDEQFIKTMTKALDKRASIEYVQSSYNLKGSTSFCKGAYILFRVLDVKIRSRRIIRLGNYYVAIVMTSPGLFVLKFLSKHPAWTPDLGFTYKYVRAFHPHISAGSPCFGAHARGITSALSQYNFMSAMFMVESFLNSYNGRDPYLNASYYCRNFYSYFENFDSVNDYENGHIHHQGSDGIERSIIRNGVLLCPNSRKKVYPELTDPRFVIEHNASFPRMDNQRDYSYFNWTQDSSSNYYNGLVSYIRDSFIFARPDFAHASVIAVKFMDIFTDISECRNSENVWTEEDSNFLENVARWEVYGRTYMINKVLPFKVITDSKMSVNIQLPENWVSLLTIYKSFRRASSEYRSDVQRFICKSIDWRIIGGLFLEEGKKTSKFSMEAMDNIYNEIIVYGNCLYESLMEKQPDELTYKKEEAKDNLQKAINIAKIDLFTKAREAIIRERRVLTNELNNLTESSESNQLSLDDF